MATYVFILVPRTQSLRWHVALQDYHLTYLFPVVSRTMPLITGLGTVGCFVSAFTGRDKCAPKQGCTILPFDLILVH